MMNEENFECTVCGLIGSDACGKCDGGNNNDEEMYN